MFEQSDSSHPKVQSENWIQRNWDKLLLGLGGLLGSYLVFDNLPDFSYAQNDNEPQKPGAQTEPSQTEILFEEVREHLSKVKINDLGIDPGSINPELFKDYLEKFAEADVFIDNEPENEVEGINEIFKDLQKENPKLAAKWLAEGFYGGDETTKLETAPAELIGVPETGIFDAQFVFARSTKPSEIAEIQTALGLTKAELLLLNPNNQEVAAALDNPEESKAVALSLNLPYPKSFVYDGNPQKPFDLLQFLDVSDYQLKLSNPETKPSWKAVWDSKTSTYSHEAENFEVGKEYKVPEPVGMRYVSFNDTFQEIADRFGIDPDTLIAINGVDKSQKNVPICQLEEYPCNQDTVFYYVPSRGYLRSDYDSYGLDSGKLDEEILEWYRFNPGVSDGKISHNKPAVIFRYPDALDVSTEGGYLYIYGFEGETLPEIIERYEQEHPSIEISEDEFMKFNDIKDKNFRVDLGLNLGTSGVLVYVPLEHASIELDSKVIPSRYIPSSKDISDELTGSFVLDSDHIFSLLGMHFGQPVDLVKHLNDSAQFSFSEREVYYVPGSFNGETYSSEEVEKLGGLGKIIRYYQDTYGIPSETLYSWNNLPVDGSKDTIPERTYFGIPYTYNTRLDHEKDNFTYIISPSDILFIVSEHSGVSVGELMAANNLKSFEDLKDLKELRIPERTRDDVAHHARLHFSGYNDDIGAVSQHDQIPWSYILRANSGDIHQDDRIRIPITLTPENSHLVELGENFHNFALETGRTPQTLMIANHMSEAPISNLQAGISILVPDKELTYYTLQEGETLQQIAQKFGVTEAEIIDANIDFGEEAFEFDPGKVSTGEYERIIVPYHRDDRGEIPAGVLTWDHPYGRLFNEGEYKALTELEEAGYLPAQDEFENMTNEQKFAALHLIAAKTCFLDEYYVSNYEDEGSPEKFLTDFYDYINRTDISGQRGSEEGLLQQFAQDAQTYWNMLMEKLGLKNE